MASTQQYSADAARHLRALHDLRAKEAAAYEELARLHADVERKQANGGTADSALLAELDRQVQATAHLSNELARVADEAAEPLRALLRARHAADPASCLTPPQPAAAAAAAPAAGANIDMTDSVTPTSAPASASDAAATTPTAAAAAAAAIAAADASPSGALYIGLDGALARPEPEAVAMYGPCLSQPQLSRGAVNELPAASSSSSSAGGDATLPLGLEVAAQRDDDWILARIVGVRPRVAGRPAIYEVCDIEDAFEYDVTQRRVTANAAGKRIAPSASPPRHMALTADRLIPLPSLREFPAAARQEYGTGRAVLALFPPDNVTSFYRAVVVKSAKKRKDAVYAVRFDDDGGQVRLVSAKYVTPFPTANHGH